MTRDASLCGHDMSYTLAKEVVKVHLAIKVVHY
jgi:hypothetical protein